MTLYVIVEGRNVATVLNVATKKRINELKRIFAKQYTNPIYEVLNKGDEKR